MSARPVALVALLAACESDVQLVDLPQPETPPVPEETEPVLEISPPGGEGPSGVDSTTAGRSFLLGFLEDAAAGRDELPFELWIESPVDTSGVYSIGRVARERPSVEQEFEVGAGLTRVPLSLSLILPFEPRGSGRVESSGSSIEFEDPVQLVAFVRRGGQSEATRLLPREELGYDYRVGAVGGPGGRSALLVVGGAANTRVTVVPAADTVEGGEALVPQVYVLDEGDTVQLQSDGDLSGSRVVASQPVAVFGGAQQVEVDCGDAAHTWEQMPPVSRLATDWLVSDWQPEQPYGYALVVADRDDTEVTLDCAPVATLQAGETARILLDGTSRVRANHPVLVLQLAIGACADGVGSPDLQLATPTALTRDGALVEPRDARAHAVVFAGLDEPTEQRVAVQGVTPLADPAVRGFAFGATASDGYAHSLGWDCVECAGALQEPASCE